MFGGCGSDFGSSASHGGYQAVVESVSVRSDGNVEGLRGVHSIGSVMILLYFVLAVAVAVVVVVVVAVTTVVVVTSQLLNPFLFTRR